MPAEGLPNGLQQIAEWNPVSAVVLWSVAILAVAAPLCVAVFKRRTTG